LRSDSDFALLFLRSDSDFALSFLKSESDFALLILRSDSDFALSILKSESDFALSILKSESDFALSFLKSESDFALSLWESESDFLTAPRPTPPPTNLSAPLQWSAPRRVLGMDRLVAQTSHGLQMIDDAPARDQSMRWAAWRDASMEVKSDATVSSHDEW